MSDSVGTLGWATEQRNPRSLGIDQGDSAQIVATILGEDALVAAAVSAVSDDIAAAVDLCVEGLAAGGRVHYVGAGTSGRLGVLDAVELYPTYGVGEDSVVGHIAGGEPALLQAVEGAEDDATSGAAIAELASGDDVIVGIAASGRTPYVRGALEAARRRGLKTVLVSSNPQAPLREWADVAILPDTGPEVITGSTRMKSGTAQKIVLNALSTATMVRMGKTYSNLMINVVATNVKLRKRVVHILQQATGRGADECARACENAGGDVKLALVHLLSGAPIERAREVLAAVRPDSTRTNDPAGIRTAIKELRGE